MDLNNKICVVGGGYWGKNHIKTLNELGALGGIVDTNQKALSSFAINYPNAYLFSSLESALSQIDLTGYVLSTPAETHFELAKIILSAGKSLLVEKPFTLNINDAKELVELSKKHSVNLMVGHLLLFHPAIMKIKELINQGQIGKLKYIYCNRVNMGKIRTKENVFWSLAPHDISIFQYLTDSYPKNIKANGSVFLQDGIFDSTITYLKYPNNIEGHIFSSWLHPFKEHRLVVIGSEGMIVFNDSEKKSPLFYYPNKVEILNGKPTEIKGDPVEIIYDKKMPLKNELKYFISHLNNTINKANALHALDVTRIMVEVSKKLMG